MIFGYFTLFVALVIEAVGAYYSVTGLAAIFSGALIPILIMGASLEVGKVTAAVWLKLNWERASLAYKLYLVPAVAFLMVLTSMGIFGFLSKAHSDQNLVSGDVVAKIAIYDEKIKTEKENIEANRKALKQMDEGVDQVLGRSTDEKGADKAVALRRAQQKERSRLQAEILQSQKSIAELNDARAPIAAEVRKVENEVGPIKYIAALIYGDNPDTNILERAVRWVIILIVAVFDPLALVLILAAQQSLRWGKQEQEEKAVDAFVEQAAVDVLKDVQAQEEHTPVKVTKETQSNQFVDLGEHPKDFDEKLNEQIVVEDMLPEPEPLVKEPEPSIFEQHPYLLQKFAHFENLQPMVSTPVVESKEVVEQAIEPEVSTQQTNEPKILATGIDVVDRPGDYVTEPEPEVSYIMDSDVLRYKGKSYSIDSFKDQFPSLAALADNHPSLGNASNVGFGTDFPLKPIKGDLYLRTDYLPSKLFKWNGSKWIETDKTFTDSYAYNEEYIKHLISKLDTGEYDPDDLTDAERDQISEFIKTMGDK